MKLEAHRMDTETRINREGKKKKLGVTEPLWKRNLDYFGGRSNVEERVKRGPSPVPFREKGLKGMKRTVGE